MLVFLTHFLISEEMSDDQNVRQEVPHFVSTSKEVIAETEVGATSLSTKMYIKKEFTGIPTPERDTNFMQATMAAG